MIKNPNERVLSTDMECIDALIVGVVQMGHQMSLRN